MERTYFDIISRCFVNIPFSELGKYRDLVAEHRINPEIGLDDDALYTASRQDFMDWAAFLRDRELACTLHAPFHDILPGAGDRFVLQAARDKLRRCFALIEIFKPRSVVCHLGYLDCVHSYDQAQWLETSLETWRELLGLARPFGTQVMFENTYETGPLVHKILLQSLDSPLAGFCLDTGHLLAFARVAWPKWLAALEPWLGQLHLHDNHGFRDEHLPVGRGDFDFPGLFAYLGSKNIKPIITLEPRSVEDLWESLNALDSYAIFDHK